MEELILDLIDYNVEDEFDEDEEEGTITIYGDPRLRSNSRNTGRILVLRSGW